MGASQRLSDEAFGQLSLDVRAHLVTGAPNMDTEVVCSLLDLARRVVSAALADSVIACTAGGYTATLRDGRCTLSC